MPCGWEGNRRSGIALAMRHRLQWFIYLRAHGLDREMSTPTALLMGYGTPLSYFFSIIPVIPTDKLFRFMQASLLSGYCITLQLRNILLFFIRNLVLSVVSTAL